LTEPKWTSTVEQQGRKGILGKSDNALPQKHSSLLPQLGTAKHQHRLSALSTPPDELHLKQQVAKRIEKEEVLILEDEQELQLIKREAEEKIQQLNKRIRIHQSKVEILKDLLEN